MRKHLTTIIIIVMFIVGLSVLLYPAISNYINQKNASRVIGEYNDKLEKTGSDRIESMFMQAQDYNKRLAGTTSAF